MSVQRNVLYPAKGPGDGYTLAGRKAVWTGELRPPHCGEWYLSGAVIEAYKAIADLSTPYHIAVLVEAHDWMPQVRLVTRKKEHRSPENLEAIRKMAQAYLDLIAE